MSMIAISLAEAILIGIVSGLVVLIVGMATVAGLRRPRRRREVDIPSGMRPGPSDSDLEKPLLEKLQFWGIVMIVLMAFWIPAIWLREPQTNADDLRRMQTESVERGHLITLPGTEENQLGFNCVACHGQELAGGQTVFGDSIVPVPPLDTVCGGAAYGHPLIEGLEDVVDTIAQGRPGTPMPSWSVRFAGAMNDEQITDLVNYIISIQQVPDEENLCLPGVTVEEEAPEGEEAPTGEADIEPTEPAEEPLP